MRQCTHCSQRLHKILEGSVRNVVSGTSSLANIILYKGHLRPPTNKCLGALTQWQFWGKRSIRVLSIQGLLRITPNQPEPPSIPSRLTPESPLLASRTRPKRARRNRHLCGPSTSATSAEIGNRNDDDSPLAPMNTLLYSGDCTLLMLSCERAWASRRLQRERKQQ